MNGKHPMLSDACDSTPVTSVCRAIETDDVQCRVRKQKREKVYIRESTSSGRGPITSKEHSHLRDIPLRSIARAWKMGIDAVTHGVRGHPGSYETEWEDIKCTCHDGPVHPSHHDQVAAAATSS